MKKTWIALAFIASSSAFAERETPISYDYVGLGASYIKAQGISGEVGGGLTASVSAGEHLAFGGSLLAVNFHGVDVRQLSGGVDLHTPISKSSEVGFKADYISAQVDGGGEINLGEDAVSGAIYIRSHVSPRVELGLSLGYIDYGVEGSAILDLHSHFYFNESFSAGLSAMIDDNDTTQLNSGVFYHF